MCFLDSRHSEKPSVCGPGILTAENLANYEILEFAPPSGFKFCGDAWMTGAVWTASLIPPEIVAISASWRERYLEAATWR